LVKGEKCSYEIIEYNYEGEVDYVNKGGWDNCEMKEKDN